MAGLYRKPLRDWAIESRRKPSSKSLDLTHTGNTRFRYAGTMAREHMEGRAVTKRAGLYLGISTTGQTVENRRRGLHAAAERHGWQIVREFRGACRKV